LTKAILEKKTLPKKTIVITFDDGYKDNFSYAFPILKKYKIPATIFLTTGYIGTNKIFWWDRVGYILNNSDLQKIDLGNITLSKYENKSQYIDIIIDEIKKMPDEKRKREINKIEESSKVKLPKNIGNDMFLTWDEVKEMSESKISFGAHTVNHPILTNITLKQAEIEIKKSKEDIEKRINTSVNTFSYPNGLIEDFNKEIIKILKKNGFICSVTAYPTMITKDTDLFELGRVPPGWSYDAFKFFISGIYLQKSFSNIMKTGI